MMSTVRPPNFEHTEIHKRKDGYWIDKFYYHQDDHAPGLIVSGLQGEIEYLENPRRLDNSRGEGTSSAEKDFNWVDVGDKVENDDEPLSGNSDANVDEDSHSDKWATRVICHIPTPVPAASMDMLGDGYNDVVVGYNFGKTMIDCDPEGGDIIWLENPRKNPEAQWKQHFIGRWPAVHRLAVGYFTQRTFPEIIAAPVVHGKRDKSTPAPLICFQKPDSRVIKEVKEWRKDIVDDGHFRLIHEIYKKSLNGPQGLDSLLIASMDGICRLYYEDGHWKREFIGQGEQQTRWQRENSFFPAAGTLWGAGTVDSGKMGSDTFAYVVAGEPFHGPYLSLYTKAERGQTGNPWKRHVLDIFGTPTQKQCWGDGPVHNIVCADIDGDGNDEILVSMFGPVDRDPEGNTPDVDVTGFSPNKGIWCYKVIDLENCIVAKWHIAPGSSARCVAGDFSGTGVVDLASVSYHVQKYYREKNPVVTLHRNRLTPSPAKPQIMGTLWGGEGMVFLPRPESINDPLVKELVEIANYAITVEVYPPNAFVHVGANDGIKPIFGSLRDTVRHKHEIVRRPLRHEPFPFKESLKPRKYGSLQAHGRLGAIVLRLKQMASPGRWKKACQVPVRTTFDLPEQGIKFPPLEFIKVCELWWGHDFKNHDFYNLSGFQFRLQDNKQNLCHMQFWTAGHNVKAEYHDHHDNAFKELHTCLSQGTPSKPGKRIGGMWAPKPSTCDSIIPESSSSSCSSIPMESLGLEDDAFPPAPPGVKHCGLEPLEEHGRIWHEDATGNAVYRRNNTVSYPRHQWAAGDGGEDKCIDVWMALEFDAWLDFDM